jgi:hypothetical protein
MRITHISQLPESLRRNHTTASQRMFLDLLNVHNRPENGDLDEPPTVSRKRLENELLLTRETHAAVLGSKKRGRGLWDAFWSGVGTIKAVGDKVMKE